MSRLGKNGRNDTFSRAQLSLPVKDRNAINEEIHGVSCMAPKESPELISNALYELSHELDLIEEKPAYNRAQQMYLENNGVGGRYGYVNTDEFRLRFLRCELFDAKKAAIRMAKYLDLVCGAYGPYALTRPFKLSDFSKADMAFLRGGDYQLMPYRDRSGRRVLCIVTNNRDDISPETRLKILIYLWVVAAEDVESQQKGMVVLSISGPNITREEDQNQNSKQQKFHENRVKTHATVGSAVPMRLTAIHFCLPNTTLHHILTRIYGMALGNFSTRIKFHLGQSVELRYALKSYGIPTELIPSTDTGNVKYVNLKQWLKMRAFIEQNPSTSATHSFTSDSDDAMDFEYTGSGMAGTAQSSQNYGRRQQQRNLIVECPGCNDVIFRRGKSMTYHPGNVMFQSLIESRLEEHDKANQAGKLTIVLELIQYIQNEKGGRFLTWDSSNSWWLDIMAIPMTGAHNSASGFFDAQELEIQSKVNYAFRDFKKKLKTQKALQVSKSSTYAFERQDGSQAKRRRPNKGSNLDGCFCSDSDNTEGDA